MIKQSKATPTGVVEQSLGFAAVLGGRDELPDETLDVLVSAVVKKAKDQDDSADRLDVTFAQPAFTSGMGQYVPPTTPTGRGGGILKTRADGEYIQIQMYQKL